MANTWFQFKQFTVHHDRCAMKVSTDACLFGAWCAEWLAQSGSSEGKMALDIGTGSGLLALMLAQKTRYRIDAIEIDKAAAAQAAENVEASPWRDRIQVSAGDVRTMPVTRRYDVAFSNPPFYHHDLKSPDGASNLAHHGTGLSLPGLAAQLALRLIDNGRFFLLFPAHREAELEQALEACGLWCHHKCRVMPVEGRDPFRVMVEGGKSQREAVGTNSLAIKTNAGDYTAAFAALLRDFYLAL